MKENSSVMIENILYTLTISITLFHLIKFITIKSKIRSKKIVVFGNNKYYLVSKYSGIIVGIGMIFFSLSKATANVYTIYSPMIYFGTILVFQNIFSVNNYQLLFSTKRIKFKDSLFHNTIDYQKISKINIDRDSVRFQVIFKEYEYKFQSYEEWHKLERFLKEQLNGKFIHNS